MLFAGLPFLHKEEQQHGDRHRHQKQQDGHRRRAAGICTMQAHDVHGNGGAGIVWITDGAAVGIEQGGNVVQLQSADGRGDQRIQQHRLQQRQGDADKFLPGSGAVNIGGLVQGPVDTHHTGDQDQGRVAVPHPEQDKGDGQAGGPLVGHDVGRLRHPPQLPQRGHHRAVLTQQRVEHHGYGGCRDDIGHIGQHLEYTLALQLHAVVGQPRGHQQAHQDLGHKVADPYPDRVSQIQEEIGLLPLYQAQHLAIVPQPRESRCLYQITGGVFKQAVIKRAQQRPQGEHQIHQKERQNEPIAVLAVADALMLRFWCTHSEPPFGK